METVSRQTMDHSSCFDAVVDDRSHGDVSYLADTCSGASELPPEDLLRGGRSALCVLSRAHPAVLSGSFGVEKVDV